VISIIERTASNAEAVSLLIFIMSPGPRLILLPDIISTDEPEGRGIFLMKYTSSAFSPVVEAVTIWALEVTEEPKMLATVNPITTVVVEGEVGTV
jgi:hypothetical protein